MRFWDVQWDNWVRHWTVFVRIAKVLMVPLYKLEKMPLPFHVCHPMPPLSSLAPCAGCPSARHNQHSCMRTLVSWLARCPVVLRRAVALILVNVSLKSRPHEDEALPYSVFGTLFWCYCLPSKLHIPFLWDICLFWGRCGADCCVPSCRQHLH